MTTTAMTVVPVVLWGWATGRVATTHEHWTRLGGYLLGGEKKVSISLSVFWAEINIPELGVMGRGINYVDAYGKTLYEFERRLRERREYDGVEWVELRRLNKV